MPEYKNDSEQSETSETYKRVAIGSPEALRQQCQSEYSLAREYHQPRVEIDLKRLKLYNNQRRDPDKFGDPLLYTIFQTVFASLYDDRLSVNFSGREEGDAEVSEILNALAEYDYDLMEKDRFDYAWTWDALFFGRGIAYFHEFWRDDENHILVPMPEVVDPLTVVVDPFAASLTGDARGRGAARFIYREIWATKADMKANPEYFNINLVEMPTRTDAQDILNRAHESRSEAQGFENFLNKEANVKGDNKTYPLIEGMTYRNGKRILVTYTPDFKTIVRYKELGERFPVIEREISPIPHSYRGVSIPDLIEDKQRMRAQIQNLAGDALKADLYPMYWFDQSRVINENDLNFGYNKFIPTSPGAGEPISPLRKASPNMQLATAILESLDASAQRATATPEIQQGAISQEKRTLGELNLVASKVDTRYALSAKIFGWSEKRFWRRYYNLYKEHFDEDVDSKIIRIKGAGGATWRELDRHNIVMKVDPDIDIESKVLSTAKKLQEQNNLVAYSNILANDPDVNRRYLIRRIGMTAGLTEQELQHILPPKPDELQAREENEMLSKGELPPIQAEDDHPLHLVIHDMAKETPEREAHIKAHREAMNIKKTNPEFFPSPEMMAAGSAVGQTAVRPLSGQAAPRPAPVPQRPIAPSQVA